MRTFTITDALFSLYNGKDWAIHGVSYENIIWKEKTLPKPTAQILQSEMVRLQAEYDANEYQRKRATEYPPVTDYLDAVVKGDQDQIQAYIDACLAVKAKYPKPEGI